MKRINKRGAMAGGIIAIVIGIILLVAVAIPVTKDVISNTTATGTTLTILNLYAVLLAVVGLIMIVGGFGMSKA